MKHDELVRRVKTRLEDQGYDASTVLKGTGLQPDSEKLSDPIWRTWHDLCVAQRAASPSKLFAGWLQPDVWAVKDRDVVLVECKARGTERFAQQLAHMLDMSAKVRQMGRVGTTVKVILAMDIDTEPIELWGQKELQWDK